MFAACPAVSLQGLVESSGPSVESSTDSHPQTPLSPVTTPTGYLRRSVSIEGKVDPDHRRQLTEFMSANIVSTSVLYDLALNVVDMNDL